MRRCCWLCAAVLALMMPAKPGYQERAERFDSPPAWEAINNRPTVRRTIKQDFGYSRAANAGGLGGEIGGLITAAAEPAWYAKKIPVRTLDDGLSASGTMACTGRKFHVLVGFFNSGTTKEWRTPNSIVLRLLGRGDVFYAFVEYATSKWRAGGDSPGGFATVRDPVTGREQLKGFATGGAIHRWSLQFDPAANRRHGAIRLTIANETAVCILEPGHRTDGAQFDRFGMLPALKSADDGGEVWLGDLTINGEKQDLRRDPQWEGLRNRRVYETTQVRPHGDFGFSQTHYAGGQAPGEIGGLVFRGDCRSAATMAAYGDRLAPLSLEKPLRASGRVAMRRGVSDSTTLIGFYNARDSMAVSSEQSNGFPRSFLGAAIEGPSSEGFYFYPAYRLTDGNYAYAQGADRPVILPNGVSHEWSLEYLPGADAGEVVIRFDNRTVRLAVPSTAKMGGTRFDRFGIVTTWIDGNGQHVYFDDLRYTCSQ